MVRIKSLRGKPMKTCNRLTTLQLPALLKQPGRHRDGDGLILLVPPNGAGFWCMRYMLRGKTRELGLGPLRLVNLAEARARARQARQALLDKGDPVADQADDSDPARLASLKTITFKEAAERFLQTDAVQSSQMIGIASNGSRRWRRCSRPSAPCRC